MKMKINITRFLQIATQLTRNSRSSHRRCSVKKSALRNFAKFTKNETLPQVFSCEFCEISKNTFSTEHLLATASLTPLRKRKMQYFSNLYPKLINSYEKFLDLMAHGKNE